MSQDKSPDLELTFEEHSRRTLLANATADKLLELVERETGDGTVLDPATAALALFIAAGRLAGRYGHKHLGARASWKGFCGETLWPLYQRAFLAERERKETD